MTIMASRSTLTQLAYMRFRRTNNGGCSFCAVHAEPTGQLVRTYGQMMILRNRFPYARWDGWAVGEHLMVVPVRHVTTLHELTAEETDDFVRLIGEYDAAGYSFYHRSHGNASKSMPHTHGHLIRPRRPSES